MIISSIVPISDTCVQSLQKIDLWDINRVGVKTANHIKSISKYINIYILITMVLGFFSAIAHAIPLDDDEEIFFPLAIFKQYFPLYQQPISILYRGNFIIMPFVMTAPFHCSLYFVYVINFQALMLMEEIRSLNETEGSTENLKFQREINKTLKRSIQRHDELLR